MLATILRGKQAIDATFAIIETFSKIRELSRNVKELSTTIESQAKLIPHFASKRFLRPLGVKVGLGGILNVMNYVKLNNSAHVFVQLLVAVYNAINIFASSRIAATDWPKLLPAHNIQNRIPL